MRRRRKKRGRRKKKKEENRELSNRSGDVSHNYEIEKNVMLFSIIPSCNI